MNNKSEWGTKIQFTCLTQCAAASWSLNASHLSLWLWSKGGKRYKSGYKGKIKDMGWGGRTEAELFKGREKQPKVGLEEQGIGFS